MAYRKRKRLSVWGVLGRLGLTGDRDEIIQYVFETASRLTFRSQDGKTMDGDPLRWGDEPMSGDDFLVGVFESLGTTKDWPGCGSPEWERLRTVALRRVVARLARDGLLDAIAVGSATDADCEARSKSPAAKEKGSGSGSDSADATDGEDKPEVAAERRSAKTSSTMLQVVGPAAKGEGSDAVDGDETSTATDGEQVGEDKPDVETPSAKDDSPDPDHDPREGVQVLRSYIRRGQRNSDGWFRGVERETPYKVIVRWASENCPGASMESLVALLDGLREVKWWDDDGHIIGAEMLRVLESELEAGCEHEQWLCVVSDFEAAIGRLRGVFGKLCLL